MIDFILTMALSSVFALEFTDMDGTDAIKFTAKKVETGEYYQPDPNAVKAVDDFDTLTSVPENCLPLSACQGAPSGLRPPVNP